MRRSREELAALKALKTNITRQLKLRSLPSAVWRYVLELPHLTRALQGDERWIGDLVDAARFILDERKLQKRRAARRKQEPAQPSGWQTAEEILRGEVLARHFARAARKREDLLAFRNRYLAGKALSKTEALGVAKSAAASVIPGEEFISGIPLLGHDAKRLKNSLTRGHDNRPLEVVEIELKIGEKITTRTETFPYESERLVLELPGDPYGGSVRVYQGSLLDELRLLSETLAEHYGWQPGEAAWFVLTDREPVVHGILVDQGPKWRLDHSRGLIVLRVQPWVTTRSVARAYKQIQETQLRAFQGDPDARIQVHPTKRKSLLFFDFVSAQLDQGASYREAMLAWNKSQPRSERYDQDGEQNFHRDYNLIEQRLVRLKWSRRKSLSPARKKK